MKLVILNGAMCSGKSTIAENLMARKERYFHLSYDSLKWQFSQYSSRKYYEDIQKLRLSMLRTLCELKYDVITESVHRASRQLHIDLAAQYQYEIVEINLEAPYEILLERWQARMASGHRQENPAKDNFDKLFKAFENEKNHQALTFRTDMQSIEEVSENILQLL